MATEDAGPRGRVEWHWSDEQLGSRQTEESRIWRAAKAALFFADEAVVAIIVLYILYKLFW